MDRCVCKIMEFDIYKNAYSVPLRGINDANAQKESDDEESNDEGSKTGQNNTIRVYSEEGALYILQNVRIHNKVIYATYIYTYICIIFNVCNISL